MPDRNSSPHRIAAGLPVLVALVAGCTFVGAPAQSVVPASTSSGASGAASIAPATATSTPEPTLAVREYSLEAAAVSIPVGEAPEAAFIAFDSVWVANHQGGSAS